jgi:hypothetical protein
MGQNLDQQPSPPVHEGGPVNARRTMMTGKTFWSLMDAWHVPDAQALELIGYPGKLGRDGKRPRFRLTTRQAKLYLLEIDHALRAINLDPAVWLHRKQRGAPFSGRSALEFMVEGVQPAMTDVLRFVAKMAFRVATKGVAEGLRNPSYRVSCRSSKVTKSKT